MKILINACYGGFTVSDALVERLAADGFPAATQAIALFDGGRPYRKAKRARDKLMRAMDATVKTRVKFEQAVQDLRTWNESPASDPMSWDTPAHTFHYVLGRAAEAAGLPWELPARVHPKIVAAVEALGADAFGEAAEIKIVDETGPGFAILEYDGQESVVPRPREESGDHLFFTAAAAAAAAAL